MAVRTLESACELLSFDLQEQSDQGLNGFFNTLRCFGNVAGKHVGRARNQHVLAVDNEFSDWALDVVCAHFVQGLCRSLIGANR